VRLHEMVVAGAVVPIWICWELTDSTLPSVSVEKNFTVAVLGMVNGAE
jgi:hypothetical protein